jgi:rod shape-determining protein MreD
MDKKHLRFPGAIVFSLFAAILVTLLPLPNLIAAWKPEWVVLTLIHWAIIMPKRSSLLLAWFCGLLIDSLFASSSILGQHAFGFVIVTFFAIRFSERINPQAIWQQAFMILVILGTYLLINLWILGVTGKSPSSWSYWLPLFSSLLVWPIWHMLLNKLHLHRKVAL